MLNASVAVLVHAHAQTWLRQDCGGRPPSPQRGALTGPANITRGDYAHWPRGTLPDGRRPLSRVRPCGPHNPRYVSCPRQRTASAVRCGFATFVCSPARPGRQAKAARTALLRSRFGLPPTRPPPRGSLKSKRPKPKPKRTGSVPSGKKLCLLARVRVAACSVRQGQALRVLRLRLRSLDSPARAADRKGQSSPTGEHTMNDPLPWPIERIIQVAHELKRHRHHGRIHRRTHSRPPSSSIAWTCCRPTTQTPPKPGNGSVTPPPWAAIRAPDQAISHAPDRGAIAPPSPPFLS